MKRLFLCIVLLTTSMQGYTQKHNLYLISGQGSDERIFQEMDWDTTKYDVHYIPYLIPLPKEEMAEYAVRMASSIDTTYPFCLVGVSLGGMICTEISHFLRSEKTIIISSAKHRGELPSGYKFQRSIPVYAAIPKGILKQGAFIAQPLFEPDRKSHKDICVDMLKQKDKTFVKRSIRMIVNWDRLTCDREIIHIHGDKDNTLPIGNIQATHVIEDGSHMMALTRASEVSKLLNQLLDY